MMKLVVEHDPATGHVRIGQEGVRDRATALDLLEMARALLHQTGTQERAAAGVQAAPIDFLARLPATPNGGVKR